jgi:hypothetical protein
MRIVVNKNEEYFNLHIDPKEFILTLKKENQYYNITLTYTQYPDILTHTFIEKIGFNKEIELIKEAPEFIEKITKDKTIVEFRYIINQLFDFINKKTPDNSSSNDDFYDTDFYF